VAFAVFDIGIEVIDRFHVHRFETGDLREAVDFPRCQSNVVSQSQHVFSTAGRLIRHFLSNQKIYRIFLALQVPTDNSNAIQESNCADAKL
jgi:hypothetical protein